MLKFNLTYNIIFLYKNKMFFDSNQVNNILNCKNCEALLNEPRLLPCGEKYLYSLCPINFNSIHYYKKILNAYNLVRYT